MRTILSSIPTSRTALRGRLPAAILSASLVASSLVAALTSTSAQASTWANHHQRIFDFGGNTDMRALDPTTDGGYVSTGFILPPAVSQANIVLTRLDHDINEIWSRSYLTPALPAGSEISPYDVKQTSDRGFILAGRMISEGAMFGAFLLKVDDLGLPEWFQVYPGVNRLESVTEIRGDVKGGGYIAVGHDVGFAGQNRDGIILAVDASGNVNWELEVKGAKYTTPGETFYKQVTRLENGRFAAVGWTNMDWANQDTDTLLTVFDAAGNVSVNESIGIYLDRAGHARWEQAVSLDEIPDGSGDLVLTGNYQARTVGVCTDPDFETVFAMRVEQSGAVQWARDMGNRKLPTFATHVEAARPELFSISGWERGTVMGGNPSADTLLMQIDGTGAGFLRDYFGAAGDEGAISVRKTTDDELLMVGNTTSYSANPNMVHFVERFDNVEKRCNDARRKLRTRRIPVDLHKARYQRVEQESVKVEVKADKLDAREDTICERVEL